jgi:hypothetical protein
LTWRPKIEPPPPSPGQWQLALDTLVFVPDSAWKLSTMYTVTVPAGVASIHKDSLLKDAVSHFTTPLVRALRFSPAGYLLPVEPTLMVEFDQIVDPEEIVHFISFKVV